MEFAGYARFRICAYGFTLRTRDADRCRLSAQVARRGVHTSRALKRFAVQLKTLAVLSLEMKTYTTSRTALYSPKLSDSCRTKTLLIRTQNGTKNAHIIHISHILSRSSRFRARCGARCGAAVRAHVTVPCKRRRGCTTRNTNHRIADSPLDESTPRSKQIGAARSLSWTHACAVLDGRILAQSRGRAWR